MKLLVNLICTHFSNDFELLMQVLSCLLGDKKEVD